MAEWRVLRGWTRRELAQRLAGVAALEPSVPAEMPDLRRLRSWNHLFSHGIIAREAEGPPVRDGAFAHARHLVEEYAFSDRHVLVAHFDPRSALLGRTFLSEAKSIGFHFLCPGRVGAVRDEIHPHESVFAWRYDTLRGHIERGREWYVLRKQHRTGDISFAIETSWVVGEFPNRWFELGFRLFGQRYQRAWHRLAYEHLRAALRPWSAPGREPLMAAPVQMMDTKAHTPRRLAVEQEHTA